MTDDTRAEIIARVFTALWPNLQYRVWHYSHESKAGPRDSNYPEVTIIDSIRGAEVTIKWLPTNKETPVTVTRIGSGKAIAAARDIGL